MNSLEWPDDPEAQAKLIHQYVMQQPLTCDGNVRYRYASPGYGDYSGATVNIIGWQCLACGMSGDDLNTTAHEVQIPNYTTSGCAMTTVIEKMQERFPLHNLYLVRYSYRRCYACFYDGNATPTDDDYIEANHEHCLPEAVGHAAYAVAMEYEQGKAVEVEVTFRTAQG